MPFPTKLLHEDEDVLIDTHPHWIHLLRPIVIGAVMLAGCGFVFVEWTAAPTWIGILLGLIVVGTVVAETAKIMSWRSTHFVVTSRRVVSRTGIVHRVGREIPIGRVQDVTYSQRLGERIFGVGTIVVETAGKSGDETFINVRQPEMIQSVINRAQADAYEAAKSGSRHRSRQAFRNEPDNYEDDDHLPTTQSRVPPSLSQVSIAQRIEQLSDLRDRGIVTEAEFAEKRAELLGEA